MPRIRISIARQRLDLLDDAGAPVRSYSVVLSSALGGDTTVPVVMHQPFNWGNVHLLCSDGLTKHVTDARIGEVLGSMTSAKQAAEQLLQNCAGRRGDRHITVVVSRSVPRGSAADA